MKCNITSCLTWTDKKVCSSSIVPNSPKQSKHQFDIHLAHSLWHSFLLLPPPTPSSVQQSQMSIIFFGSFQILGQTPAISLKLPQTGSGVFPVVGAICGWQAVLFEAKNIFKWCFMCSSFSSSILVSQAISSLWPTAKPRIAENGDGRIYGAHGAGNFDLRSDRKWKDKYLKPKTSRAGPKRSQHAKMIQNGSNGVENLGSLWWTNIVIELTKICYVSSPEGSLW